MPFSYNILNFIRAVAERLMLSNNFQRQDLTDLLDGLRADLAALHEQYSAPAPDGAELTRDLLLEALELYDHSIAEMLTYLEDNEVAHLPNAVWLAEEANDVVLSVEDVVKNNKQLLADAVAVEVEESPLTIEQVLAAVEQRGLTLPERTFRYYATFGLLPTTDEKPAGKGDGRWHYYPPSTVDKLLTIRSLQVDGYSLKQIKEVLALRLPDGPASSSEPGPPGIAARLLRAMADLSLADALRRIRTAPDEGSFRQAVLDYYRHVLRSALGDVDLETLLRDLSPLEVQALLRPFRATTGRARGGLPPWLDALRTASADANHWIRHLQEVQAHLAAHPAQKDPRLQAVCQAMRDAVAESLGLWQRRSQGETIRVTELEPIAARLRASLAFLKSARTLKLWE